MCLDKTFAAGQAYVKLSRVISLNGLVIEGFHEKFIYCNYDIADCLNNMPSFINKQGMDCTNTPAIKIMMHNVQGLKAHYMDLTCNSEIMKSDIICLTEAWTEDQQQYDLQLDNFKSYHQPRCLSYDNSSQLTNITATVSWRCSSIQ